MIVYYSGGLDSIYTLTRVVGPDRYALTVSYVCAFTAANLLHNDGRTNIHIGTEVTAEYWRSLPFARSQEDRDQRLQELMT